MAFLLQKNGVIIIYMEKRIMPDGYFFILLVLGILLHFIFPIMTVISFPFNLIGIIPIAIGFLSTLRTNILLLKKRTAIMPFEVPNSLVASGPFKLSRNPIYLGMAIVLIGVGVVLGSLSPFRSYSSLL